MLYDYKQRERVALVRNLIRSSVFGEGEPDADPTYWPNQLSWYGDVINKHIADDLERLDVVRVEAAAKGITGSDESFYDYVAGSVKLDWLTLMARRAEAGL